MKFLVGCALLFALTATAGAQAPEAAASRKAFLAGMKHFDLGEYKDALEDFKLGYRIKEDPVFLYNIAQCYRALSASKDALRYYRLYLTRAPDAPNRGEVEQKISSLQTAIAADDRAASIPPSQVMPTAAEPATSPPSSSGTAASASVERAAPGAHTPVYKKWWLWTIVGVVAAGAAVGIALGVTHAGSSSANWPVARF